MDDYQEYFRMASIYTQVHASKGKTESKPSLNSTNNYRLNNNLNQNSSITPNNNNDNNTTVILVEEPNKSTKFSNGSLNNLEENSNLNLIEVNNISQSFGVNNNGFSLRNSQKENNNIQYTTGNEISAEEDYYRNIEEYSNTLCNSSNNNPCGNYNQAYSSYYNNPNISQSLLLRHSKTVYVKNQSNLYSNLLESNSVNNTVNSNNNNSNYSLLSRNSMLTSHTNIANFNSTNNITNIFSDKNLNQKTEENQNFLGLRKESSETNHTGSFSSTTCSFGRMSNPIFSGNFSNNQFASCFNQIDVNRKPSLDCLPFMRSNSQTFSDMNVLNSVNMNITGKTGFRSKKDEMKKWLSRI